MDTFVCVLLQWVGYCMDRYVAMPYTCIVQYGLVCCYAVHMYGRVC